MTKPGSIRARTGGCRRGARRAAGRGGRSRHSWRGDSRPLSAGGGRRTPPPDIAATSLPGSSAACRSIVTGGDTRARPDAEAQSEAQREATPCTREGRRQAHQDARAGPSLLSVVGRRVAHRLMLRDPIIRNPGRDVACRCRWSSGCRPPAGARRSSPSICSFTASMIFQNPETCSSGCWSVPSAIGPAVTVKLPPKRAARVQADEPGGERVDRGEERAVDELVGPARGERECLRDPPPQARIRGKLACRMPA